MILAFPELDLNVYPLHWWLTTGAVGSADRCFARASRRRNGNGLDGDHRISLLICQLQHAMWLIGVVWTGSKGANRKRQSQTSFLPAGRRAPWLPGHMAGRLHAHTLASKSIPAGGSDGRRDKRTGRRGPRATLACWSVCLLELVSDRLVTPWRRGPWPWHGAIAPATERSRVLAFVLLGRRYSNLLLLFFCEKEC